MFMALQVNKGAVATTSRDTGVPEQTVREWKQKWLKEPPSFDDKVFETAQGDFIERTEYVRDLLLKQYTEAVERKEVKPDKMPLHMAILIDKVAMLKGIKNARAEPASSLPSPEHVRAMIQGAVQGALASAQEREQDIIDAEIVEQPKGLPVAT